MTFAVGGGGGSPKSRQKEQNQLICDSDRWGPWGSGFRFTSSYIFPMYGTMYIYKGLDAHSMMV